MAFCNLLKIADQRSKDTVFGYLRELQNMVDPDYSTPQQIEYCCLEYYLSKEVFTERGDNMTINQTMDMVTNAAKADNTAYGSIIIDPSNQDNKISEYKWDFKFLTVEPRFVYIGLDSSDKENINTSFVYPADNKHIFYGFATDGWFDWQIDYGTGLKCVKYGEKCRKNDKITMILNIKDATLRYEKNGKDFGIVGTKINLEKKYHLAVNIYTKDQSVQIVDFQTN